MIPPDIDLDRVNFLACVRELMHKGDSTAQKGIIDKLDELIIKELNPIQTVQDEEIPF